MFTRSSQVNFYHWVTPKSLPFVGHDQLRELDSHQQVGNLYLFVIKTLNTKVSDWSLECSTHLELRRQDSWSGIWRADNLSSRTVPEANNIYFGISLIFGIVSVSQHGGQYIRWPEQIKFSVKWLLTLFELLGYGLLRNGERWFLIPLKWDLIWLSPWNMKYLRCFLWLTHWSGALTCVKCVGFVTT